MKIGSRLKKITRGTDKQIGQGIDRARDRTVPYDSRGYGDTASQFSARRDLLVETYKSERRTWVTCQT